MTQAIANDKTRQVSGLLKMELRHVEASKLTKLSAIIDTSQGWERLLEELSKKGSKHERSCQLKLSLDNLSLIKQQFKCGKSPTLALLNHWSITGRRRPTISTLLEYLDACHLKWGLEYVLESILGIKPTGPSLRPPTVNSEDSSNSINLSTLPLQAAHSGKIPFQISDEFKFESLKGILDETVLSRYSFESVYETTSGFSVEKIGEGRFSTVFKAHAQKDKMYPKGTREVVAAKLLKSNCNEKYLANEITLMAKVKHVNILELLGIALIELSQECHTGYICLIYPYIENGSLLDCLAFGLPAQEKQFLSHTQRFSIALKVARGLKYLHSFESTRPIVHRDVKTANIFIDKNLEPKVGDFTLVRQLDCPSRDTATQFSQNITGTSVYMPPEAFRGDISIKFDTFSYGIVLLELLTGMRPFNEELDEDLFTYVNEKLSDLEDEFGDAQKACNDSVLSSVLPASVEKSRDRFLSDNLDRKAGEWNFTCARELFRLALEATDSRKKSRPRVADLLNQLELLLQ